MDCKGDFQVTMGTTKCEKTQLPHPSALKISAKLNPLSVVIYLFNFLCLLTFFWFYERWCLCWAGGKLLWEFSLALDGSLYFQICPTLSVALSLRQEAGVLLPGLGAQGDESSLSLTLLSRKREMISSLLKL